jgi:heparan-alpha-glucosaminide N-acetyltransferase
MALPSNQPQDRLASIDVYRGFVMFLMMAEVLHLSKMAGTFPDSAVWKSLAFHQTHAEWAGCSLHDLIQPSFSFLVGTALPFSLANREARGQKLGRMLAHAAWRAILLTALGVFLRSMDSKRTNFTFEDTLSQIGMGYFFLFLLALARPRWWWVALVVILVGYWALFAFYPLPGSDFDYQAAGAASDWQYNYSGFAAHWNKNTNPAWAFDRWFLNLFPRKEEFLNNGGGYATLSFIPTLGTMILGLIAGGWLRAQSSGWMKIGWLVVMGAACLAAGGALDHFGICPSVKRIWTPAWVLYSGGWCFVLLAGFYLILDVVHFQFWAYPLRVIGANSIVAYCMAHLINGFVERSFKIHLGPDIFKSAGEAYEPFVTGIALLVVQWLILYWMYRKHVYVRI